ncbi:MAG: DUF2779 domain-containing protein, partial [Deltaproteobacteria bacterium]|nr:DUF2779 domain-containing protein [Deltaproteobacteria bacterium]
QGHEVGEEARRRFPGGVLVDSPHYDIAGRVRQTQAFLAGGAKVIFEASFLHQGVFVAVDVLQRTARGWHLLEVKSSTKVKDEHHADIAVQRWVARGAGVDVERAYLLHLNGACEYPALSDLFTRVDLTKEARALEGEVASEARAQLSMLAGSRPKVAAGTDCNKPYPCPFFDRCHDEVPAHHISTLYRIGAKSLEKYTADGVERVADLDEASVSSEVGKRQVRAVTTKRTVVEPGLVAALAKLRAPLAFLDFETVGFAIPRYPGCSPWMQVAAQASVHVEVDGELVHHEHLAMGTGDPRPALARFVIERLRGARTILCWSAQFERGRLKEIGEAFPKLKKPLDDVCARIVDLLPIVRDHVYHPGFNGSFSLKSVAPALVPALAYDGLEIGGGQDASAALYRMLSGKLDAEAESKARAALLEYCALDTRALVEILAALRKLAAGHAAKPARAARSAGGKRRARV